MSDTLTTSTARLAETEFMETKTMTAAPGETVAKRKLKADLIIIGGGSGGHGAGGVRCRRKAGIDTGAFGIVGPVAGHHDVLSTFERAHGQTFPGLSAHDDWAPKRRFLEECEVTFQAPGQITSRTNHIVAGPGGNQAKFYMCRHSDRFQSTCIQFRARPL